MEKKTNREACNRSLQLKVELIIVERFISESTYINLENLIILYSMNG